MATQELNRTNEADRIVRRHVLWSMGAGLIPVPLFDIAAVTAVQIDMLKQLAALYEVDYSTESGKTFASALTSSTFARIGASLVKTVPGIGSLVGGVSMSALSGASTYAVGKLAINIFEERGNLFSVDLDSAKQAYTEMLEQGKQFVSNLGGGGKGNQDVFQTLEKLSELKEKGVITEEDFEAQKQRLLDSL